MDISKIQINNVNYNLKDASAIASGIYDSSSQKIVFKNKDNVVICQIDATPFIVDGMVSNVAVSNGNLVITFNTDAGKSPISIPLTDIFNPAEYYTKIGYFVCDTAANTAAKTINAAGFALSTGGSIKIKMTNDNTANNATLNINSTGAKPLYYAGLRASSDNTWESGETIEVYYDGTNYMANNVAGGGGDGVFDVSAKTGDTYESLSAALTAMDALPSAYKKGGMSIKYIQSSDNNSTRYVQYRLMAQSFTTDTTKWQGVDEVPAAGSSNLVESGGTDNRINLLPLKTSPMCIQTNVWNARDSHWTIPVNGGETVEYLRSGSDNTIYYALLTEYSTPVAGQTPAFLTGYEGRRTTNRTFLIPSGCKYLVITYINDFSYIKINGYNILNGIWPIVLKAIDSGNIADGSIAAQKLNQAFVATLELVANKKGTIERLGSSNDYVNAVCLYRKFVNLDSALQGIDVLNLFEISDYGFIKKSTGEPVTSSTSTYNLSAFIPVVQGHSYRYRLSGSSNVYIIAEYSSNQGTATGGVAGNNSVKSGVYVPESGVNYVRLSSEGEPFFADMTEHLFAFESEITDVTNALGALDQAAIKDSDLTIEATGTNNMANPANIMTGMISNTGAIRTDVTTWEMIKVDVTAGTVVSFGGFNLGRTGYAAFYDDNNVMQGSKVTIYYSNGTSSPVTNLSVPTGATKLYIDIKSDESPASPYANLMVNLGATLLPYEPYTVGKISKIKGYGILGADSTLDDRVADLEEEVEELIEQGTTIPDLIADLPVSDGTDIASGYAYIDSTTYNVKVKQ